MDLTVLAKKISSYRTPLGKVTNLPNELKSLKTGEALLVCTKVDPHFCIMKINLAEEYSSEYVKMGNGQGTIIDQGEVSQYPERQNNPEALQPQDLV